MKKIFLGILAVFLVASPIAYAKDVRNINMGSVKTSTSAYIFAAEWAKIINKYVPSLSVTVVETAGTVEDVKRCESGDFPIHQFANPDAIYQAYRGIGVFDKPYVKTRMLFQYGLAMGYFFVRADSGIKSFADLKGKSICPGPVGSLTAKQAQEFCEALGINVKWYHADWAEGSAALKDRRIPGYVKAQMMTGIEAGTLDILARTKLIMLTWTKEEIAKLKKALPWQPFYTVEAGYWKPFSDMPEHTTWVFPQVAGAHATLISEQEGYEITKASVEHAGEIASAWKSISFLHPVNTMLKILNEMSEPPYLHLGAIKYYREKGYNIPNKIIPPEAR